jgi:hypothetical protein
MAAIMISVAGINCENLSCNKRGVHIWDDYTPEMTDAELLQRLLKRNLAYNKPLLAPIEN